MYCFLSLHFCLATVKGSLETHFGLSIWEVQKSLFCVAFCYSWLGLSRRRLIDKRLDESPLTTFCPARDAFWPLENFFTLTRRDRGGQSRMRSNIFSMRHCPIYWAYIPLDGIGVFAPTTKSGSVSQRKIGSNTRSKREKVIITCMCCLPSRIMLPTDPIDFNNVCRCHILLLLHRANHIQQKMLRFWGAINLFSLPLPLFFPSCIACNPWLASRSGG